MPPPLLLLQTQGGGDSEWTLPPLLAQELKRLGDDANVFKMIGPALIKQDLVEARSNVTKRMEYIIAELDRLEAQIKTIDVKLKDKEAEVGLHLICVGANVSNTEVMVSDTLWIYGG